MDLVRVALDHLARDREAPVSWQCQFCHHVYCFVIRLRMEMCMEWYNYYLNSIITFPSLNFFFIMSTFSFNYVTLLSCVVSVCISLVVWLYRWTWIWQTQWDQENWSVICKIRHIHIYILEMHGTGTKNFVRHRQKSVVQYVVRHIHVRPYLKFTIVSVFCYEKVATAMDFLYPFIL